MKALPPQQTWYFSTKCFPLRSLLSENALEQNFLCRIHPLWQNSPWERLLLVPVSKAALMANTGHAEAWARVWTGSLKGRGDTAEQSKPWGNTDFWKTGVLILVGRTLIVLLVLCPVWFFLFYLHWEKEPGELYKAVYFPGVTATRVNDVLEVFLLVVSPSAGSRRCWAWGVGSVITCAASLLGAIEHRREQTDTRT